MQAKEVGMMFHVEQSLPPEPPAEPFLEAAAAQGWLLDASELRLTLAHARLLAQWNRTTSLVQARSWEDVARRHFSEGWAAAKLLPARTAVSLRLLDVGSGGGIPALPLHVRRPDVAVTLVEPRGRKAAFLTAVARHHPEPRPLVRACRLEELAVGESWDIVSHRGIRLSPTVLLARLSAAGRILRFPGHPDDGRAAWEVAGLREVASEPLLTYPLRVEAWERS